jgi:membrane protein
MNDSIRTVLALFRDALKRLFADEAIPLAGNIAFRTIFAIFPFLIFLTTLAGFFGSAKLAEQVVNFLLSVAPAQIIKPLASEIQSILTVPRSGLLSISALLTIWSAMAGVDSVRVGLNRAYNLKDTRSLWYVYAVNVVFVIAAAALLLVVAVLLVLFPVFKSFLSTFAPAELAKYATIDALRYPLAFMLLMIGLQISHYFLPAQRMPMRFILPGVVLTVIVWVILSAAFSIYLVNFNSFASTYSSLSGLFAAMFFVYLSALALIFGGEVNRVISQFGKAEDYGQKP